MRTITISKESKKAIRAMKTFQADKRRLGKHLVSGGKLDDFEFSFQNISFTTLTKDQVEEGRPKSAYPYLL